MACGGLSIGALSCQQYFAEVTKVRRNLFNQETMSSKKAKMPRSQSVSAVDVMKKRKRSQVEDGNIFVKENMTQYNLNSKI